MTEPLSYQTRLTDEVAAAYGNLMSDFIGAYLVSDITPVRLAEEGNELTYPVHAMGYRIGYALTRGLVDMVNVPDELKKRIAADLVTGLADGTRRVLAPEEEH